MVRVLKSIPESSEKRLAAQKLNSKSTFRSVHQKMCTAAENSAKEDVFVILGGQKSC